MKALLTIALLISLLSCVASGDRPERYNADTYNYAPYAGKKVKSIKYCDNCASSGDLLIITFEDGTTLKVYAYKYVMEISR